jgi:hypothetical protein
MLWGQRISFVALITMQLPSLLNPSYRNRAGTRHTFVAVLFDIETRYLGDNTRLLFIERINSCHSFILYLGRAPYI